MDYRTPLRLLFALALTPALLLAPACGPDKGETDESSESGTNSGTNATSSDTGTSDSSATLSTTVGTNPTGTATEGMTTTATTTTATSTTNGVETCEDAIAQVNGFLGKNQPCEQDSDCVQVEAGCWEQQQDCCVIYLNASHSLDVWGQVYAQYMELCGANECGCCAAIPAEPACVDGQCGPGEPG